MRSKKSKAPASPLLRVSIGRFPLNQDGAGIYNFEISPPINVHDPAFLDKLAKVRCTKITEAVIAFSDVRATYGTLSYDGEMPIHPGSSTGNPTEVNAVFSGELNQLFGALGAPTLVEVNWGHYTEI